MKAALLASLALILLGIWLYFTGSRGHYNPDYVREPPMPSRPAIEAPQLPLPPPPPAEPLQKPINPAQLSAALRKLPFDEAVALDGQHIRDGFGPEIQLHTQPDGSIQ